MVAITGLLLLKLEGIWHNITFVNKYLLKIQIFGSSATSPRRTGQLVVFIIFVVIIIMFIYRYHTVF